MESEEAYQHVLAFSAQLLAMKDSITLHNVVSSSKTASEAIKSHFEKCINTLEQRRDTLLRELDVFISEESVRIASLKDNLQRSIDGCTNLINGASMIYKDNKSVATAIWKSVSAIQYPYIEERMIGVEIPYTLLDTISTYGSVTVKSRRIPRSQAGHVSTIVPLPPSPSSEVSSLSPSTVHFDSNQKLLYVSDARTNTIKKISLQGTVTPVIGCRSLGGIAVFDKTSTLYYSDTDNHTIKKASQGGMLGFQIDNFAGGAKGWKDGAEKIAAFNCPGAIAIDQLTGTLYVADVNNYCVRKISQGVVSTLAGTAEKQGNTDGIGVTARFQEMGVMCYSDHAKALYLCDSSRIREIKVHNGEVKTIPLEIQARGIVALESGMLLVSSVDDSIYKLYRHNVDGKYTIEKHVGTGKGGNVDGQPSKCQFSRPHGISFDDQTNTCFVADLGNSTIRKFTFV